MSSNHGAECNRGNRPFILTSARLSTTARGAAHRRKWLISGPERALRCGAPPPPLPAAHLSRRWPEARWPSCESVDERTGVWSWPAPRVQPDVLLDVGVGPERAQGGRNPPQRTVSRAGGVEPARIRAGERAARGSIFAANSSSVSCSRTAFGGATSRRAPSPMAIRPTAHRPAPGCRPRVTGWSPRSRPPLGWEMPSPANQPRDSQRAPLLRREIVVSPQLLPREVQRGPAVGPGALVFIPRFVPPMTLRILLHRHGTAQPSCNLQ